MYLLTAPGKSEGAIHLTNPANPVLDDSISTSGFCTAVTVSNGRLYVADGIGGLVFLK